MNDFYAPDAKSAIRYTSRQLFYELAIHHHHYLTTRRFRTEAIPGQDPEYQAHYANLVTSHNYAMLALTLCKVMEFHSAFRTRLQPGLRDELDKINSRIARSHIIDYRNKFVGHLFDSRTKLPLEPETIAKLWDALLEGQSEEEFRRWWWSKSDEPDLKSVAGLMVRIADSLDER
jgi:hypothetical protein